MKVSFSLGEGVVTGMPLQVVNLSQRYGIPIGELLAAGGLNRQGQKIRSTSLARAAFQNAPICSLESEMALRRWARLCDSWDEWYEYTKVCPLESEYRHTGIIGVINTATDESQRQISYYLAQAEGNVDLVEMAIRMILLAELDYQGFKLPGAAIIPITCDETDDMFDPTCHILAQAEAGAG